jgi:hypothetical protein
MDLYIANYPVEIGFKDKTSEAETLPKGTPFTVVAIGQMGLKLKPLKAQTKEIQFGLEFSGEVLSAGFTKVDQLPN